MERHLDPYSVLEVNADASPKEIAEAYHTLLTVWHPQRFEDNAPLKRRAAERCELIRAAYNQLSDGEERYVSHYRDLPGKLALLALVILSVSLAGLISVVVLLAYTGKAPQPVLTSEPKLLDFTPSKRERLPSPPRVVEASQMVEAPLLGTGLESNLYDPKPALVRAAIECDMRRLKELLRHEVDVHETDRQGETALAWAVKRNCKPAVRELLARGADAVAPAINGYSPLQWAQLYDHYQIELLLRGSNRTFIRYR